MEKEIINLIDTSIKIGLGATIASISTYLITRYNHKAESKKDYFKRYISSIEKIAESAEDYYINWGRFVSSVDGVSTDTIEKGITPTQDAFDFISEKDIELVDSRDKKMKSIARLKLLDLKDVSETLEEIRIIEKELRKIVIFEERIPSINELLLHRRKMKDNRDEFYKKLSQHYKY